MPLLDVLQKQIIDAMKAKDERVLGTLRMMKTALMKEKVDSMKPLTEAVEMQILKRLIKQRQESADMFRKGNRPELAENEEAEQKIIESYLPAGASEEDVDAAVAAAVAETGASTIKDMGTVMKAAQAKLAGKTVDGKMLSDKVKARLSAGA
jgi:uncharacterized protein